MIVTSNDDVAVSGAFLGSAIKTRLQTERRCICRRPGAGSSRTAQTYDDTLDTLHFNGDITMVISLLLY